jgi:hypothetical protein
MIDRDNILTEAVLSRVILKEVMRGRERMDRLLQSNVSCSIIKATAR